MATFDSDCIPWRPSYSRTRRLPSIWKACTSSPSSTWPYLHRPLTFTAGDSDKETESNPSYEAPETPSNSSSPSFAPRGRPTVRPRFRNKLPPPLRLAIPQNNAVAAIHNTYSVIHHQALFGISTNEPLYRKQSTRGLAVPKTRDF